jgi:hypothetical protein
MHFVLPVITDEPWEQKEPAKAHQEGHAHGEPQVDGSALNIDNAFFILKSGEEIELPAGNRGHGGQSHYRC